MSHLRQSLENVLSLTGLRSNVNRTDTESRRALQYGSRAPGGHWGTQSNGGEGGGGGGEDSMDTGKYSSRAPGRRGGGGIGGPNPMGGGLGGLCVCMAY